jgi:hypothetical protein
MTAQMEALKGSLNEFEATLSNAVKKWLHEQHEDLEKGGYAWVMAVFPSYVVVCAEMDGERKYLAIDYTVIEDTGDKATFELFNERQVAIKTEVVDVSQDGDPAGDNRVTVVKESRGLPADATGLKVEALKLGAPDIVEANTREREPGDLRIWSRPTKLEAVRDSGGVRKVRGRVPLMIAGATTKSNTNYTVECAKALYNELAVRVESVEDAWTETGPWPVGAMYLSHGDRLNMPGGFNNLGDIAAKFTGVYVEGGKAIGDIQDGDVIGVTFETLSTPRGQALVALLTETNFVKGISLAGFKRNGMVNESDGVDYVKAMKTEQGFGADFCDRPNTPYERPSKAAPKLESEVGKEGKTMSFEELLKDASPEVKAQFEAMKAKATEADSLKAAQVEQAYKSAGKAALESYTAKLGDEDNEFKLAVLEAVSAATPAAIEKVKKEHSGFAPESDAFKEALVSELEAPFKKHREQLESLRAAARRAAMEAAGLPPDTVPEKDPAGGRNDRKLEAAPYINTLPYETLCVESDNERVGLPRGQKHPDGRPVGARLTDVVVSKWLGNRPVYVEHPDYGGKAHILDVRFPGLREKVQVMSEVYSDHIGSEGNRVAGFPFMSDQQDRGTNDSQLRQMESYKRFNAICRGDFKAEANEMTTAATLGTLHPDIRQGILEVLFATAIWPNIATLVPCKSDSYKIAYNNYRRTGEQSYGTVSQAVAFAAGAGSITYASRAWIKVTTAIGGADAVCTITYTNENGTTGLTTQRTVPVGTASGQYFRVFPQTGERIKEITDVTVTGWTSGALDLIAETDLNAGSELAVSGRAKANLDYRTGTVEELSLDTEISWRTIEDANMSLANHGPGRTDAAALVLDTIVRDFADWIDLRGMNLLNDATDFLNINTMEFDSTSPDPGYSAPDWKKELIDYISQTSAMVESRGFIPPSWMLVNLGDRHKFTWFGEKVDRNAGSRTEAFIGGASWGRIHGMNSFVSQHQNHNRMLMGARDTLFYPVYVPLQIRGPLYNGNMADQYIIRQRSAQLSVRPETRGYLSIVE